MPPINRDELIKFVVEAVPGQAHVGVGNDDTLKAGVIKILRMSGVAGSFAVFPISIDGQNEASIRRGLAGNGFCGE